MQSHALRRRYGKARAPKLTREDLIDLELAQEGLRQFRENPNSGIPIEDVKRYFGIK